MKKKGGGLLFYYEYSLSLLVSIHNVTKRKKHDMRIGIVFFFINRN